MQKIYFKIRVVLVSLLLITGGVQAERFQDIEWNDLTVGVQMKNPLGGLSEKQIEQIGMIRRVKELEAVEWETPSEYMVGKANEYREAFKEAGMDADQLLEECKKYDSISKESFNKLVETMKDAKIRLPGFMVPTEFEDKLVKEFLLVPWGGACIHTPPPPMNQIVHITLEKPVKPEDPYVAIVVEGTMVGVGRESQKLWVTDGHMNVGYGYKMIATSVKRFTGK